MKSCGAGRRQSLARNPSLRTRPLPPPIDSNYGKWGASRSWCGLQPVGNPTCAKCFTTSLDTGSVYNRRLFSSQREIVA